MLPPIVGKIIRFSNFNKIPLLLIIMSLIIRVVGDFIPAQPLYSSLGYMRELKFLIMLDLNYILSLCGR
jgi:hypothetical protein